MKVLMVGATGNYANLVLPELKKHGVTVRALVRNKDGEFTAHKKGADEVAIGDLQDSESLRSAAHGVEGVFHINPAFAPHESEMGIAMVEAAKAAGVRKFVFSGVIHPSISKMVNHRAKLPVEEALYHSGMNFAVLQPAMFMQTLDNGWAEVLKTGRFSLPYSKQAKACYVDYRDVAEVAALAFANSTLDYGTFELCAAGMVNRIELAEMMSEALAGSVEAGELQFDDWAQMAKIPDGPVRTGLKTMYAEYDKFGFPGGNALVLRAILSREPRTLKQYVCELAARKKKVA